MDSELRMLINNLTQDIIDAYHIQIPILDIDYVVTQQLGGRIEESPNIENMSDGSVRKEGNGFVIYVSPYQTTERRTFTIAHELGHLFLHMGYVINQELWERPASETYYRFGDSLIMDQFTQGNIVETGKVADYFRVSVSAASTRGKFLGYLQW